MDPKQLAGEAALEFVKSDTIVGLGTGSTAKFFIAALGRAVGEGKLRNIRCVPTSVDSQRMADEASLPVVTFAQIQTVDITVDGADEIAPDLSLIKGLGGALLREKMVAQNSRRLIIIADASKVVSKLGTKSPLPVEVTQFGHEAGKRFLQSLGCVPTLRPTKTGEPFITDNGNYIYDCKFPGIDNPTELNQQLATRSGIVESGLFLGLAEMAIVADEKGVRIIHRMK